jgi:protein ImuA
MASPAVARETVFALRREIAKIEGRLPEVLLPAGGATVLRRSGVAPGLSEPFLATGITGLDAALGGGLPKAALTEIHALETRDAGAASGFALALATLLIKTQPRRLPLLWIATSDAFHEGGFPYTAGLAQGFGIAPDALLFSQAARLADVLWIAEEAARLSSLSAVIVELRGNPDKLDLTATRRLHRRAQLAGRPLLLVRQAAFAEPTAAPVRLVVAPAPAARRHTLAGPLAGSLGAASFSVSVSKSLTSLSGAFILEWNSHDFAFEQRSPQDTRRLVSLPRDGAHLAPAPGALVALPAFEKNAAAGRQPAREQHTAHRGARRAG